MAKQPAGKLVPRPLEPTPISEWKKVPRTTDHVPLVLPSGNTALVKPLGLPEIMKRGLIPNPLLQAMTRSLEVADARMANPTPAQAAAAEKKAKQRLDDQLSELTKDPAKLVAVFDMADNLTLACMVQPAVHPVPPPGEDGVVSREDDLLYIDEVDMDDKMFIMSYAMSGVRDLESFRREFARSVGSVGDGGEASREAKRFA
jgi:hypothetical protein